MTDDAGGYLARQFGTAWRLADHHLGGLTTAECLRRPARSGPHVWCGADGLWRADWPEREDYGLGPPSIAWVTWHMIYWTDMLQDHDLGAGTLTHADVTWPGDADAVAERLRVFEKRWRNVLKTLTDADLRSSERTRWPFRDRPFGDVCAWVNIELTKNAAEIGYARFLLGAR